MSTPTADGTVLVAFDERSGVLQVLLNRPAAKNALGWAEIEALQAAFDTVAASDVRAVVLGSVGGTFCAGGDLKSDPARGGGVTATAARLRRVEALMATLATLDRPVVAAVEGPAVGVGWALALACDAIVVGASAYFASPFVSRALVPDGGLIWFLVQRLGRIATTHLVLDGARIGAQRAVELGLVTAAVDDGTALHTATDIAERWAGLPADAALLTKRLIQVAQSLDLPAYLDHEWVTCALNLRSPDALEGRAAFAEGRSPRFNAARPAPADDSAYQKATHE